MPHFSIEYSSNVKSRVDIQKFCDDLLDAALETGIFPLAGIRVRAICCEEYSIADKNPDNAFMHMVVRIGQGRDFETKKSAGKAIFDTMCAQLASEFDTSNFAFSMEIREIDKDFNWKKNSLNDRLK